MASELRLECATPVMALILLDKRRYVLEKWVSVGKEAIPSEVPFPIEWLRGRKKNSKSKANGGTAIEQANKKCEILIVDDSTISAKVVAKKIHDLGLSTETAFNGQLAYDLLLPNPKRFAAVVCDICMPVCDGGELLDLMKETADLKDLPVIMLSSLEGADLVQSFIERGAVAVLKKPVDDAKFLEALTVAKVFPQATTVT